MTSHVEKKKKHNPCESACVLLQACEAFRSTHQGDTCDICGFNGIFKALMNIKYIHWMTGKHLACRLNNTSFASQVDWRIMAQHGVFFSLLHTNCSYSKELLPEMLVIQLVTVKAREEESYRDLCKAYETRNPSEINRLMHGDSWYCNTVTQVLMWWLSIFTKLGH